ncbi:RING-H2 finger protein ATL39-like [Punica granatum]|uniref:RING-type E3 ubiquitin transferase n=2 Tax=Punica granatum TaxID=22663 RepID=A0A218X835_PUNGR|nr:RING-H2 finger protein ATL39-like [Punica granatum]OWM80836.1 hypothetical protein CDL15_Pgr006867 [Punica granatum]PKI34287.1 hypothetical protein CRG98_045338 [Punica granatum]
MAFSLELLTPSSPHNQPSVSFPFISLLAIVIIYAMIAYLIIDFVGPEEDLDSQAPVPRDGPSGMSLEELQDLPQYGYSGEASRSCAICLNGYKKGDMYRIFPVCRHIFHCQCIDTWLLRSRSCPICRSPFGCRASLDIV